MARLSAEEMFKNMIGRKDEEPAAGTGNCCRADCGKEESLHRAGDRASAPGAA